MRQVLQQQTRVSLLWFLEGHFISGLGHDPEQSFILIQIMLQARY